MFARQAKKAEGRRFSKLLCADEMITPDGADGWSHARLLMDDGYHCESDLSGVERGSLMMHWLILDGLKKHQKSCTKPAASVGTRRSRKWKEKKGKSERIDVWKMLVGFLKAET